MTHLSGGAIFGIAVAAIVVIPAWLSLAIHLTQEIFKHDRQREGHRFLPQSDPARSVMAFWLFLLMLAISPAIGAVAIVAPVVLLAGAIVLGIVTLVVWLVGGTGHILGFYACCCCLRRRKGGILDAEVGRLRGETAQIDGNSVDGEMELPRVPAPPYQRSAGVATELPPGYEMFCSTSRRPVPVPEREVITENEPTSMAQRTTRS